MNRHSCVKMRIQKYIIKYSFDKTLKKLKSASSAPDAQTDEFEFSLRNAPLVRFHLEKSLNELSRKAYTGPLNSWACEMIDRGKTRLTENAIIESLSALDDENLLTAAEILQSGHMLIVSAGETYLALMNACENIQLERSLAEAWVGAPDHLPVRRDSIYFLEHALRLSSDCGLQKKREKVLKELDYISVTEDQIVSTVSLLLSKISLRLDNIVSAIHTVNAIQWDKAFTKISRTEKTLLDDPSGLYPLMDEKSKSHLRREIEAISRFLSLSERSVASRALEMVREGDFRNIAEAVYTDEGRQKIIKKLDVRSKGIRKMVPDPEGKRAIVSVAAVFLSLIFVLYKILGGGWVFVLIPAIFCLSEAIVRFIFMKVFPTRPLLKLKIADPSEEQKTLVVIPALLTSKETAENALFILSEYAAHEDSENIDFLLLGDYKDSEKKNDDTDEEIHKTASEGVMRLNKNSSRERFFYLQRERIFNHCDQIWMGRERKRGALEDLNRLLLTGENRFTGDNHTLFERRYQYVLTVDSDTRMLPGTIRELIGAISHPLNSKYAVIQPRMETFSPFEKNTFVRLMKGTTGKDQYDFCACDFFNDITGFGLYCGKGIYHIKKFHERTEGVFKDNTVLSHDLIEGIVTGAGFDGECVLYESFPKSLGAYLSRLDRWTRGDWQLVYYLFGKIRLTLPDRYKLISNLIRSLKNASVALSLVFSALSGSLTLFLISLGIHFAPVLLNGMRALKSVFVQFALLPVLSYTEVKAACTALVRIVFTRKKCLEWVTAAQSHALKDTGNRMGWIYSALLIPGLFERALFFPYFFLIFLFALFPELILYQSGKEKPGPLLTNQYAYLSQTARSIWRYFEKYVPVGLSCLPPDNVQIEPPVGEQKRTSPTNIAMYLLSVIGAYELGFTDTTETLARLKDTSECLNKLETRRGLFYNWYDSFSLKPAFPRFISSVDLGNLLAAMITVRNFLKEKDDSLSERYENLIVNMDIGFLFNTDKNLFSIGYDVENGVLSASHYDLYASEARILSFAAISERKIPLAHWEKLARPFVYSGGHTVPASWSGTMFEYMMPNLLLYSPPGSMGDKMLKGVCEVQKKHAKEGIWGISESGYYAFDQSLNYQYRAFGISSLALSGAKDAEVFSPYAVILALEHDLFEGTECLKRMQEAGLKGEYGFYEALDTTSGDNHRIVYSYMTHHQGMSFVSLVNLLTGGAVRNHFLSDPKQSAVFQLLDEKPIRMPLIKKIFSKGLSPQIGTNDSFVKEKRRNDRIALPDVNEGHILFTRDILSYFDSEGRSFMKKGDVYLNVWNYGAFGFSDSLLPVITDDSGHSKITRVIFDTGSAVYELKTKLSSSRVTFTLSPESESMLIKTRIKNDTASQIRVSVLSSVRLALSKEEQFLSHPMFSDLFIFTDSEDKNGSITLRRDRDTGKISAYFMHRADREVKIRTDKKALDRSSSIESLITIPPFEAEEIYFELKLSFDSNKNEAFLNRNHFEKARIMLTAQMNAHLEFSGVSGALYRSIDRRTSLIFCPNQKEGLNGYDNKVLWPLGLSGETPVIMCIVSDKASLKNVKRLIRAHEFYRYAGIRVPLVVLCVKEAEYFTPLKDAVSGMIDSSHLRHLDLSDGGGLIIHPEDLTDEQMKHLMALSAFTVRKDFGNDLKIEKPGKKADSGQSFQNTLPAKDKTNLISFNGYGGFVPDTGEYTIIIKNGVLPPRRWSNFLVNDCFGALTTDSGISFLYKDHSLFGRITPFLNSAEANENGVSLYLTENGKALSLTPDHQPGGCYTVTHGISRTVYRTETEACIYESICFVPVHACALVVLINAENKTDQTAEIRFHSHVSFLMGSWPKDIRFTHLAHEENYISSGGKAPFYIRCGYLAPLKGTSGEIKEIRLAGKEKMQAVYLIADSDSWNEDESMWLNEYRNCMNHLGKTLGKVEVNTGNKARDLLSNGFLKYQSVASRYLARFGLYQPGGAFGFRDQLQDTMSFVYYEPELSRKHILTCAKRQFETGDALHWWHEPRRGVKTRIKDDVLFLALAASHYIKVTQDYSVLKEILPYLENVPLNEDEHDRYSAWEESSFSEPLYNHIMRAFRYALKKGAHGLLLMGGGDWNDGMNKIGIEGRGESVWLSEFWIYTAEEFLPYASEDDKGFLESEIKALKKSLEEHAWDGKWYLRAFHDSGEKIGSALNKECRIDLISQAWAVLAHLDTERAKCAVEHAERMLYEKDAGLIRLLAPPFSESLPDPGYIAAYPNGIRENGGQYTHAVCWLVKAYAKLKNAEKAWEAFDLILPINRTDTMEKANHYGGEPYVVSADISFAKGKEGVCGWTWYTGAASWAFLVLLEDLLGFELKGNQARMHALLRDGMEEARITLVKNNTIYTFISRRSQTANYDFVTLPNDGGSHTFIFSSSNV